MGLDVTFYKNVKLKEPCDHDEYCETEDEYDWETETHLSHPWAGTFDHAVPEGFQDGVYGFDESQCLGVGYGRHMLFRLNLIEAALGSRPSSLPQGYTGPFCGLVNFADNEGTIMGEAINVLRVEFQEYRERYKSKFPEEMHLYDKWLKGIEFSADGGALDFH